MIARRRKQHYIYIYGGFLKWWVSPTTIGFPTKNDHFGVFWGYHHLRKHPVIACYHYIYIYSIFMIQHQKQCHPLLVRSSKALSKWRERIAATQDTPDKQFAIQN